MAKIVYNAAYGGFGLSEKAKNRYREINRGVELDEYDFYYLERNDPVLVQVVEELGVEANSWCSNLVIQELPAGTLYRIKDYYGYESIILADEYTWSVA